MGFEFIPAQVRPSLSFVGLGLFTWLVGCEEAQNGADSDEGHADVATHTYHGDAKSIIDARCATCHQDGDIGPFPLTTYEEVSAFLASIRASIDNGTMPPWQPSDDCNTYLDNIDLTTSEREVLLAWLDEGAPEGEPTGEPEGAPPPETGPFAVDMSLRLPEAYAPRVEPDDHRCQLIPWPAADTRFVTGTRVTPDQRSIVHHVIIFVVGPEQVAEYQAYDEAEDGPGYTCFGGPTPSNGLSDGGGGSGPRIPEQIGFWVPGMRSTPFPAGTGIRVEPGSMLVAQMHYNTSSSAPVADQSVIEIATIDSVEREATVLQAVDFGWVSNGQFGGEPMTIPAGEPDVAHDTSIGFDSIILGRSRRALGLADDAPLVLYTAGHHMHELGKSQYTELQHADGSTSCLLDTPDWDFSWQGRYTFANPVTFGPGDTLWMGCTWDNSASNQPIINGEVKEPKDVEWGEGTSDEMCLSGFYVTGQ
jgi:hypothetical protein